MVNAGSNTCVLSNDATPITFLPRPGALAEYRPLAPLLPIEATTTMPLLTSRDAATAVGYCGHWNAAPMLMLRMSMPSLSARSIAAIMISDVVEPLHPNTRYAPNVTPGATPRIAPFAPTMPATCVPWPLQSSGIGSGVVIGLYVGEVSSALKASPTKSQPVNTRHPGPKQPPRSG